MTRQLVLSRQAVLAPPMVAGFVALVALVAASAGSVSAQSPAPAAPPVGRTSSAASATVPAPSGDGAEIATTQAALRRYCYGCHNTRTRSGNFVLEGLDLADAGAHADAWERVVRKLRGGLMPPARAPRPDDASYRQLRTSIERRLDRAAAARPNPGRTEVAHRLNRLEYANAVRDLLGVEINAVDLLPADDSSYGFDNIAGVLKMSSALMERYLAAARTVSRLAVGSAPPAVGTAVYRVSSEVQQHERIDGLPFGTRGGTLIRHSFPQNAEYEIKVGVTGRGGGPAQQLEVSIDGARVKLFTLEGRQQPELRVPISGGPHDVAVTFLRTTPDLVEQVREPFLNPDAPSGTGGQAGLVSAVSSVTIAGPYNASGPGDTVSRRQVFTCRPETPAQESRCARSILSSLARRAYRGTVPPDALDVLLRFFDQGRADGGSFDAGIELALRRMLVSPEFLYRIEADPAPARGQPAAGVYRLGDHELASRLSFFLWSSIPDAALLDAADQGALRTAAGRRTQVRRMLADPKARTLAENFGGQWLQIRNMPTTRPGETFALAFDETLRQAMQRETELLLDSVIRENRGVMELLTADYTFLNERLAQHYNLPGIQGSHFRRVALAADSPRRGLLGHGSILTLTSPAIRTSPVIRGKWILNNILGAPPPDPPPNVPALPDRRTQAKVKTMRERMAQHRSNPVCSTCHSMIDPTGFALENFDAIGRWRTVDESYNAIDASGQLPDGSSFTGVTELRASLAARPERFAHTVTERLMTYALGRGVEPYDMPAIRTIMREAAAGGFRFQSLILGLVQSYPFLHRRTADEPSPQAAVIHR